MVFSRGQRLGLGFVEYVCLPSSVRHTRDNLDLNPSRRNVQGQRIPGINYYMQGYKTMTAGINCWIKLQSHGNAIAKSRPRLSGPSMRLAGLPTYANVCRTDSFTLSLLIKSNLVFNKPRRSTVEPLLLWTSFAVPIVPC